MTISTEERLGGAVKEGGILGKREIDLPMSAKDAWDSFSMTSDSLYGNCIADIPM
ncbi:MAG: hypothetical protein ABR881_30515 [Candidatus Sulfotelmatobacter sp.]